MSSAPAHEPSRDSALDELLAELNDTCRVLVVDDDEDDFLLTRRLVGRIDRDRFAVEWVKAVGPALERLRTGEVDVCLLDHRLGAESSLDVLDAVSAEGIDTPVIVLTGSLEGGLDRAVLARGAADYLEKGEATATELERSIRYALARQRALRERGEAEARFKGAFRNAPIGMALVAIEGEGLGSVRDANAALGEIAGRTVEELVGLRFATLAGDEEVEHARAPLARLVGGAVERLCLDQCWSQPDGRTVWVTADVSILRDRSGRPHEALLQVQDVTQRVELESRLRYLADHDPLTALLNRRSFEARLTDALARLERYGEPATVCLLDLDSFKPVNDTFGHAAGDEVLQCVAEVLRRRLRATDAAARIGGDEFAVLLTRAGTDEATAVVEEVLSSIRACVGQTAAAEIGVSASCGVAPLVRGGTVRDVLRSADEALYAAKAAGRDRAVLAGRPT